MASFLKRRQGFIFKVIIGIPLLWFSFIGIVVVISGPPRSELSPDSAYNPKFGGHRDIRGGLENEVLNPPLLFGGTAKPVNQPVIERPNMDRLRLEERMQFDGVRELRNREQKLHGRHIEEGEKPFHVHLAPNKNNNNDGALAASKRPSLGQRGIGNVPPARPSFDPDAPGEQGKAVKIDKDKLSPEERKKFDEGWRKNAFNQYASDMMSLHRSLPEVRDKECLDVKYHDTLPDTSVIVCFHNEAQSVLLRTVHSILDRSPPQLIREIILVDDFSDMPHLKEPLEEIAAKLGKVRVVRAKRREGLIRARLLGASVAKGDVLTYLDSHCECAEGWLEPLLDRIVQNKSNVVTPVIDVIDDESLRFVYGSAKHTSVGGFDWNLQFNWHAIPDHEKRRRPTDLYPVRSPTMAGGLFSISREYFEHLGAYDPGMDIWGGENLELSFRIWMCGGSLEIIPCSHVGHIFRKRSPYSWKTGINVVKKNSVRLAEVWMDEYKNYYYERFNFDLGEYGDISARKELRKRLQCKSFDWFVKNIYPDLFIPGDALASGEIRNKIRAMCLDSAVEQRDMNKAIKMWPCHNQGGNQYWMLSKHGEIRRDEGCMDYAGQFVMIYPCHGMKGNQEWVYGPDNTLRHRNTNLCMELTEDGNKVEMKPCTGIDRQIWLWNRKTPDSDKRRLGQALR